MTKDFCQDYIKSPYKSVRKRQRPNKKLARFKETLWIKISEWPVILQMLKFTSNKIKVN